MVEKNLNTYDIKNINIYIDIEKNEMDLSAPLIPKNELSTKWDVTQIAYNVLRAIGSLLILALVRSNS